MHMHSQNCAWFCTLIIIYIRKHIINKSSTFYIFCLKIYTQFNPLYLYGGCTQFVPTKYFTLLRIKYFQKCAKSICIYRSFWIDNILSVSTTCAAYAAQLARVFWLSLQYLYINDMMYDLLPFDQTTATAAA